MVDKEKQQEIVKMINDLDEYLWAVRCHACALRNKYLLEFADMLEKRLNLIFLKVEELK